MIEIVATLAEIDSARQDDMGRVLGIYLLRVAADAQDDEVVRECLSIYWRENGRTLDKLAPRIVVAFRRANPETDALLYAQNELRNGATVH